MSYLKKNIQLTILILAIFMHAAPSVYAATIRVNSPKIMLEVAPGQSYSGEISYENPTEEELKAHMYVEDWVYKSSIGEKTFTPAGSTPLSASKWITFSPADAVLAPFSRGTVQYTIHVPENAVGGYYSVLFFETILGTKPSEDEEGVNVLVAGRVGALFFVEAAGTVHREGKIQSVAVKTPEGNSPMEITTTFQNTGNVDISLEGKFLIMDSESKVLGRGDIAKLYTFPKDTASSVTQWVGRLAPGSYQLLLTYDLGKGQTLVEEKTFSVS